MPRIAILVLALLVMPLAGCLQSKDAVVLNKDGSGTITSTYVTELQHLRDLMGMYAMMQGEDPEAIAKVGDADLPNAAAPAWFRAGAAKAKGYDITAAQESITDGKRETTISAQFASLEAAARGGAFFASTVTLSRVEKSEKAPKGAWKLTMRNALSGGGQSDAMGGMDPATALQMVEAQLNSLSVKVSMTVPTKILDHNGTKAEKKNEVTWHVTYDMIVDGKTDVTMSIVFEPSDELKLKPFTYAPDARALARRAMNKPPKPKKPEAKKDGAGKDEKKPAKAPEKKKADAPASGG